MFKLYTMAVTTIGLTVIACNADERLTDKTSKNITGNVAAQPFHFEFEPLIRLDSKAERPFQLNEAAAAALERENNKLADEDFHAVMRQIADLIAEYPDSPAARRAEQMIDNSDQVLTRNGRLYPKGTIFWGGFYPTR